MKVASVEAIIRALNAGEVRFIVVGGIAVNAHGHGRTTFGVDLVIQLDAENVRRAFQALEGNGYRPLVPITAAEFAKPQKRDEWKREKGMLVLQFHSDVHRQTRVDIFTEEPFDFETEWAAAFQQTLPGETMVPILRLESLLRMKEAAGRPKDLEDVKHLRLTAEEGPRP